VDLTNIRRPKERRSAGLAASAVLGGADALPQHLHPDLLLGANDLGFGATRRLLEVAG